MRVLLFYLFLPFIVGIGVWRPFWGLAIYLAANIIRPDTLFWGQDTAMIIFKVSIAATLLGFFQSEGNKIDPLTVREWWLALWICLAMTVCVLFADLPENPIVWSYVGDSSRALILYWLILGVLRKKQQALQLMDILLLMATLLSLWGWQQHFGGNARLEGLGGFETNGVAALGVLFLPLAVHKLFTASEWWQKLFGLGATIMIAGMIVFTNSRGGFLGLAAGCLYLLLISRKRIWLGICYFLVLLAVVPLLSSDYLARLNTIDQSSKSPEEEYSAGSRVVLWNAGWLMFKDNPIFGVGLFNFPRAKAPYRVQLAGKFDNDLLDYSFLEYKVGHSTWFGQVLPEGGLFLAIPMFWLFMSFFWRTRKLPWTRPPTEETRPLYDTLTGLEAGFFGYLVSITFVNSLYSPFLIMHVILSVQVIRIIENSNPRQTQFHEDPLSLSANSFSARSR